MKKTSLFLFIIVLCAVIRSPLSAQCPNFESINFDSFGYTTVCPYIIPNATVHNTPQVSPAFGPSISGNSHLYLNFVDGFTGLAFSRPYEVCIGATYRISFHHREAWGNTNETTFNIRNGANQVVYTTTITWNGSNWNHFISPELQASDTELRLEIVNNSSTLGTNDMIIDDMRLEQCMQLEEKSIIGCEEITSENLFSKFDTAFPTTGTWTGPSTLGNGHLGTFSSSTNENGTYTYSIVGANGCTTHEGIINIVANPTLDLGPDFHFCNDTLVTLDAGPNYSTYLWSTGATTSSINVTAAGTYTLMTRLLGDNIVQNGDFEAGTTAAANNFTSSYTPGTGGNYGLLSAEGQYVIATSPNLTHNHFVTCNDVTTGSTNMFVANGSSTPNTVVWSQNLIIEPNTDYRFSFWVTNVVNNPQSTASLQLLVNGSPIGVINQTGNAPCNWTQVDDIWNSGSNTNITLSIMNHTTGISGNDFALDNIEFRPYCSYYDTVVVTTSSPNFILTPNTAICIGDTATIIATPTTAGVFTYNWSNGANTTDSIQQIAPQDTTTINVYITDQFNCSSSTKNCTIAVVEMPTPDAGFDHDLCFGDVIPLNGSVNDVTNTYYWAIDSLTIPAGTTFSFSLPPNQSSSLGNAITNVGNITPTDATLTFYLAEGNAACGMFYDTVIMTFHKPEQSVNVVQPTCFESNDASISIVNNTAIQYSLNNQQSWGTNSDSTGLAVGTYHLWSEDQFGCKDSSTVLIVNPQQILLNVVNDTTICENGSALLTANVTGNTTLFSYHWDHTSDTAATQQVQPTVNQIYQVYAEDSLGCRSDSQQISVTIRPPLQAQLTPDVYICPDATATFEPTSIQGGLPPYSFSWSNGAQTANNVVTPESTTTYSVTISDACESTPITLSLVVHVETPPVPAFSVVQNYLCEPAIFELTMDTDTISVQSFTWLLPNNLVVEDSMSVMTSALDAGSYPVTLNITSTGGCEVTLTQNMFLIANPKPLPNFMWNPHAISYHSPTIEFKNLCELATSYNWIFEQGMPNVSNAEHPSVTYPVESEGNYKITLIATNQYGCIDTLEKIIETHLDVIVYAPNSFTPDGDKHNNTWGLHIIGHNEASVDIQIYNRWGEMIWQSHDADAHWDGTYKNVVQQAGTYSWVLRVENKTTKMPFVAQGHLNIIK